MDFKEISEFDHYKFLMHLMSIGVLLAEQVCLKCKIKMSLSKKASVPEKYAWRCWKCKSSYSVKNGSFFEGFKIPVIKSQKPEFKHEQSRIFNELRLIICLKNPQVF